MQIYLTVGYTTAVVLYCIALIDHMKFTDMLCEILQKAKVIAFIDIPLVWPFHKLIILGHTN